MIPRYEYDQGSVDMPLPVLTGARINVRHPLTGVEFSGNAELFTNGFSTKNFYAWPSLQVGTLGLPVQILTNGYVGTVEIVTDANHTHTYELPSGNLKESVVNQRMEVREDPNDPNKVIVRFYGRIRDTLVARSGFSPDTSAHSEWRRATIPPKGWVEVKFTKYGDQGFYSAEHLPAPSLSR